LDQQHPIGSIPVLNIEDVLMKLNVGDVLYEPLSRNNGEVTRIYDQPDGKIVKIRWRLDGHLPHDTEHTYKKVLRCIKNGDYQHSPKASV